MTREEAIKVLQALWRYKDCGYSEYEIRESLEIAIKILEQDLYKKAYMIEKVMQAKRQNNLLFNKYNKFYLLSLENYYNDVNDILSNLIKEFDKEGD